MKNTYVMDALKTELKQFIIETLALEDTTPEDIDNDMSLFEGGLGLDSIDALELGIALKKKYAITIDAKTKDLKKHFSTVNNLAGFLNNHTKTQADYHDVKR